MNADDREREDRREGYEAPQAEDLASEEGTAATASGAIRSPVDDSGTPGAD